MPRRRTVLTGILASAAMTKLGWADVGGPVCLGAAQLKNGTYALCGIRRDGSQAFQIPLPDRGHAAAAHPSAAEAVAFARRPGTFAITIDCRTGQEIARMTAPFGHHFYGHGAFTADGKHLLTPENDIESGEGRIGIWSRQDGYQRVGEISSGGIGPHEIIRLSDGSFAIANGGIKTHPDRGREKLNLDTMRPNLTILAADLTVRDQAMLDETLHQNSIRHIAAGPDGSIACACQWQGDVFEAPPLLAIYRPGQGLVPAEMDVATSIQAQGYLGSVACTSDHIAVTSPRGGQAYIFDLGGSLKETISQPDVCGAASVGDAVLLSDGLGGLQELNARGAHHLNQNALKWDNHLVAISA